MAEFDEETTTVPITQKKEKSQLELLSIVGDLLCESADVIDHIVPANEKVVEAKSEILRAIDKVTKLIELN